LLPVLPQAVATLGCWVNPPIFNQLGCMGHRSKSECNEVAQIAASVAAGSCYVAMLGESFDVCYVGHRSKLEGKEFASRLLLSLRPVS